MIFQKLYFHRATLVKKDNQDNSTLLYYVVISYFDNLYSNAILSYAHHFEIQIYYIFVFSTRLIKE